MKRLRMKHQLLYQVVLILTCLGHGSSLLYEDVHSRSMFDLAKEYLQGQGEVMLWMKDYVPKDEQVVLEELVELINSQDEEDSSCSVCKAFFTFAKAVAAALSWEEVRDGVVDVCHMIFNGSDVRHDVLCPGVVDLQGPHVFEIAKARHRKSAEEICTFLNSCLPPKSGYSNKVGLKPQEKSLKVTRLHGELRKMDKVEHLQNLQEKKKSAMKIVQLTDIHIEPDYAEGSSTDCGLYVCCDIQYGAGDAGRYGDYRCNLPPRTIELFLQKAAEIQPEVILYSGDSPPSTLWDETYHSQVNCSALVVEIMEQHLHRYRVLPNIGNHEMYPTNLYSVAYLEDFTKTMNEEFTEMWTKLADFSPESKDTMRQGGYYTELIRPGLRLLSFNTNYWYTFNWYNVLNNGSTEVQQMLVFMRETLKQAEENYEKVIMQGHHPPGIADTIVLYSRMFEDLLTEYSDIITLHVAGHTHFDEFRVHSDLSGTPISVMFTSPSITSSVNKNPSLRVFYLDNITHEILDFEQHGFNLDEVKGTNEPNITLVYSAVEDYGLENMSPASWRDLIDRMESDDELFEIYLNHYNTGYGGEACNMECRWQHLCHSQFYSYDDIVECQRNVPLPTDLPTTTIQVNGGHTFTCGMFYMVTVMLLLFA